MSLRIENQGTTLANLRNAPRVSSGAQEGQLQSKSIGETPPKIVPFSELGDLAALFGASGKVTRLRKRLNRLKNKKCKVSAALGTIACIDDNDMVYLGIEFLEEVLQREDGDAILAGVMAHEWGHACAERPNGERVQQMNWDEIFAERRSHEAFADEMSGRLLALLGQSPEPLVGFLKSLHDTHNLKYHDNTTRETLIRKGFAEENRKKELAREIFKTDAYQNNYSSTILEDDL